jgi:hypothetical protein
MASDWLTLPSTYTHDVESGARVAQFQPNAVPTVPAATNFRSSGYTHTRSSINYGQSADNYHRVERWGDPVRPYGEWRFPYRPFSTPYPNWGPPYAGLNLGFGFRPFNGTRLDGRRPRPEHRARPPGQGGDQNPGNGHHGGQRHPSRRPAVPPVIGDYPFSPYPAGPATPYPVAPYYDGYHPVYRD